ncbi:MAG: hypothetical protein ACJAZ0_001281 [Halioglobus sp.]|jgi:hypothetical protein
MILTETGLMLEIALVLKRTLLRFLIAGDRR